MGGVADHFEHRVFAEGEQTFEALRRGRRGIAAAGLSKVSFAGHPGGDRGEKIILQYGVEKGEKIRRFEKVQYVALRVSAEGGFAQAPDGGKDDKACIYISVECWKLHGQMADGGFAAAQGGRVRPIRPEAAEEGSVAAGAGVGRVEGGEKISEAKVGCAGEFNVSTIQLYRDEGEVEGVYRPVEFDDVAGVAVAEAGGGEVWPVVCGFGFAEDFMVEDSLDEDGGAAGRCECPAVDLGCGDGVD